MARSIYFHFYKDGDEENKPTGEKYTKIIFFGVYKDALKLYSKMIDIDPDIAKILVSEGKDVNGNGIKSLVKFVEKEIGMFDDIAEFFVDMFGGKFTKEDLEDHVPAEDVIGVFGNIIQLAKTSGFQMGTT